MQITKQQFIELTELLKNNKISAALLLEEDFHEDFDFEVEGGVAIEGSVWGEVDTQTRYYNDSPPERDTVLLRFNPTYEVFDGEGNVLTLASFEIETIDSILEQMLDIY